MNFIKILVNAAFVILLTPIWSFAQTPFELAVFSGPESQPHRSCQVAVLKEYSDGVKVMFSIQDSNGYATYLEVFYLTKVAQENPSLPVQHYESTEQLSGGVRRITLKVSSLPAQQLSFLLQHELQSKKDQQTAKNTLNIFECRELKRTDLSSIAK